MIKSVTGDILKTKAQAIAHGVAPHDSFNQGLALSLRQMWPAMYKDFKHYCRIHNPKEGKAWSWKGAGGPAIISLFTQEHAKSKDSHPGKASLSYLRDSLKALKTELKEYEISNIAIPKLATGVGGLDWNDVKPLIEECFTGSDIKVQLYETYKKDVAAEEA